MEKDYLHYNTDEFVADEFFQRWVKSPDNETNDFWNKWILANPAKRDEVMKACAFINHVSFNTRHPSPTDVEAALGKSFDLIEMMEAGQKARRGRTLPKYALLAAALMAGLIILIVTVFVDVKPTTIEIITGASEIRSIVLPDSSAITLNANSSIKYESNIDNAVTREVWLTGEAFFNIKHVDTNEKSRRFIVYSDDLNVEVLGTSFNVKKRKDVYNVSLNSGNIKIRLKDDEGSTIFLTPGDFFQYSATEKYIVKKKVKTELYSDWKNEKMVLNNTPLSEVAELIHDSYGYKTIIEDRQLSNEKISGTLMLTDENVLFKTLSFALNINIIKKEKDLIFQSKTNTK